MPALVLRADQADIAVEVVDTFEGGAEATPAGPTFLTGRVFGTAQLSGRAFLPRCAADDLSRGQQQEGYATDETGSLTHRAHPS